MRIDTDYNMNNGEIITSLTHSYKCKFVHWQKEKRNIGEFTAKLTILCYDQLHTSLQSNGMAAIPKRLQIHQRLPDNSIKVNGMLRHTFEVAVILM